MTLSAALAGFLARPDASWTFYHSMEPRDREAMDAELVASGHPLAFQPGTQWDRFQALHRELHSAKD